jgi:hypothetical protein
MTCESKPAANESYPSAEFGKTIVFSNPPARWRYAMARDLSMSMLYTIAHLNGGPVLATDLPNSSGPYRDAFVVRQVILKPFGRPEVLLIKKAASPGIV